MGKLERAIAAAGFGEWADVSPLCGFEVYLDELGEWVAVNARMAAWASSELGPGAVRLR
jgi:hypothetical protein